MDDLSAFILGFFIAVSYVFDVFYSEKNAFFFLRSLAYVLSVTLPLVFNKHIPNYAYYGFATGVISSTLFAYFFVYRKSIKKIEEYDDKDEDLEFFNLLMNGYGEFKRNVKEKLKLIEKQQKKYNKVYLKVHEDLKSKLPDFITEIYAKVCDPNIDFKTYATFVLQAFINEFFSNSYARFTLRMIDKDKKIMKALVTTRKTEPSPIPLNQPNMISRSLKLKKPAIYSENKKHHYDTKKSIKNNEFDDYVTYCLFKVDNGKLPALSVNLDVKGEEAVNRMKAFVKTNMFSIVCNAITLKHVLLEERD